MKGLMGLFSILVLTGSVLAVTPAEVKALRQGRKINKNRVEFLYKFEDKYVTPAAQATKRGSEAARAWAKFDKKSEAVAVLAHSPFGGGESAKSYWPVGVKNELLKNVVEPLKKTGVKNVVLTDTLDGWQRAIGAASSAGSCAVADAGWGGTVTCTFGAMVTGTKVVVTLTAQVSSTVAPGQAMAWRENGKAANSAVARQAE